VADHSFPTPIACGAWLRTAIDQKRANQREAEQAKALQEARSFGEQIKRLEETNRTLAQAVERETQARREVETKEQARAAQEARSFRDQLQRLEETNRTLAQAVEREVQGRREVETRLLGEVEAARALATRLSQQVQRQEETNRVLAQTAERDAQSRRETEARLLGELEASRATVARVGETVADLQTTLTARQDELERLHRDLAETAQAGRRAWKVAVVDLVLAALSWASLLVVVLFRR
jgi:hypothetical protein